MPDLDQWADARKPAGEEARPSINALELAEIIHRTYARAKGTARWEDLDSGLQRSLERSAERVLVEIGARDLSDPQHALIARIRSAGDALVGDVEDMASRISEAVDEALGSIGLNAEAPRVEGWVEGVRYVIQELDEHGLADVVGGTSRLDSALRAFEREARTKAAP